MTTYIHDSDTGNLHHLPESIEEISTRIAEMYGFELDPKDDEPLGDALQELGWKLYSDDMVRQTTLKRLLK